MEENSDINIGDMQEFENDYSQEDSFHDFEESGDFSPPEVEKEFSESEQDELAKQAELAMKRLQEQHSELLQEFEIADDKDVDNAEKSEEAEILESGSEIGENIQETEEAQEIQNQKEPETQEIPEASTEENLLDDLSETEIQSEIIAGDMEKIEPETQMEFQPQPEIDKWEEINDENSVVKKYIVYIAKDFVPQMDSMTTDERSAYINDAIQIKLDVEEERNILNKKKRILAHVLITVLTFFIVAPVALFIVHKSIMMTFENYKYSQDNFEKLYKQRFEKDRAYIRSLQYNKIHEKDIKKEQ